MAKGDIEICQEPMQIQHNEIDVKEEIEIFEEPILFKSTHSEERQYRCSQCDSSQCDLKIHLSTLSVEKPYQCSQCKKAFAVKNIL